MGIVLPLLWCCGLLNAGTAGAEYAELFRCDFEESTCAAVAAGSPEPLRADGTFTAGRTGRGIHLADGEFVTYAAAGNFPLEEGKLEFDFCPDWDGNETETRLLFTLFFSDGNYLQLNKIGSGAQRGRLGGAWVSQYAGEKAPRYCYLADAAGKRADVSSWRRGEWHRIELEWTAGHFVLSLDGREVLTGPIERKPAVSADGRFTLGDRAAGTFDGLRITGPGPAAETGKWSEIPFFPKPAAPPGWCAAVMDPDGEPEEQPLDWRRSVSTRIQAQPGTTHHAAWVVSSGKAAGPVKLRTTGWRSDAGETLPATAVTLWEVVRQPECFRYNRPRTGREPVRSRFLRPVSAGRLQSGEGRLLRLRLEVPPEQPPGRYRGAVEIAGPGGELRLPVVLEVAGPPLPEAEPGVFGIYYSLFRTITRPRALQCEIEDLRRHGVTLLADPDYLQMLFPETGAGVRKPDTRRIRRGLAALRSASFRGTVVVNCGLGEVLKHYAPLTPEDGNESAAAAALANPAYRSLARETMAELQRVRSDFPEFHLWITTLDEVFNQDRLPLYCAAVTAAKETPGFAYYATFHFLGDRSEAMRKRLSPLVDYRSHHMYSWEWYLARQGGWTEYERELQSCGARAGVYCNPVGLHEDARRYRLAAGVALAAGPLTFFVPWTYCSGTGDLRRWPENYGSHVFGFYDEGAGRMISTPRWEAYREGVDDWRRLAALKRAGGAAAQYAAELLARAAVPSGLESGPDWLGTEWECPWSAWLEQRFSPADLQKLQRLAEAPPVRNGKSKIMSENGP